MVAAMPPPPRVLASDYMHFAKQESGARYNLASSGVLDCTLDELGLSLGDLALHGPNAYGYAPLLETIAARFGLTSDRVVTAAGASFANHLAFAALIEPGEEVLIEDPAYELLTATLGYFQADIRRFTRRPDQGWRLDPDAVAAALTPRTRLVVLTNLHNPSGALAGPQDIEAVAAAAAAVGARLLIDEVYLELTFADGAARTAFRPGANIVVTSSLTKAYGLSGLRCGWILAPPDLAWRMRRLNDLFASLPPHAAERMSVAAFERLPALRARAAALLEANRAAYDEILGGHPALEWAQAGRGTTVFPRLRRGDGDALLARLRCEHEVSLVPGRFFGRPEHFRIGLGGDPALTREGLRRLALALSQD
jgi:aspartate/methionine/tyrosine aminotransferase